MIQVIERFHRILLEVARCGAQGCPMGKLAKLLEISVPACSNIVRTMTGLGYLRSLGPRLGYVLGDTPYFIARNGGFRQSLLAVARPLVLSLTQKVNELAVLVVEHDRKRCELLRTDCSHQIRVNSPELLENLMMSPTGCVILSQKSSAERKTYWDEAPGETCLNCVSFEEFDRACAKIALEGKCFLLPQMQDHIKLMQVSASMAAPVWQGGKIIAAVGMMVPMMRLSTKPEQERIMTAIVETCEAISRKLDNGEM